MDSKVCLQSEHHDRDIRAVCNDRAGRRPDHGQYADPEGCPGQSCRQPETRMMWYDPCTELDGMFPLVEGDDNGAEGQGNSDDEHHDPEERKDLRDHAVIQDIPEFFETPDGHIDDAGY